MGYLKISKNYGWTFIVLELTNAWSLPEGFVYVDEVIPSIKQDIRYFGVNNFVGRPVNGYHTNRAILTKSAASALKAVQEELSKFGLGLLVFDAYRPQQAVDDFVAWSKDDKDTKFKSANYPQVSKDTLISEGFIAEYSGHSRGSTIDLTIVSENAPFKQLDMGTQFDFLDQNHGLTMLELPHSNALIDSYFKVSWLNTTSSPTHRSGGISLWRMNPFQKHTLIFLFNKNWYHKVFKLKLLTSHRYL